MYPLIGYFAVLLRYSVEPLWVTVGAPTAKLAVGLTVGAHSGDSQWGLTVGAPTAKLAVGLTVGAPTAKLAVGLIVGAPTATKWRLYCSKPILRPADVNVDLPQNSE